MASSAGGALVGACLLLILLAGGLQALQQKVTWGWLSIAVRIAGSWITAISLLLGALMLRGKI
jgi:RsiW-degrading membrane proteinase PrsW (M82 family)